MLEIIYRIYEVPSEEQQKINLENDTSYGVFSSTSKAQNTELLMDCMLCDSREQFKEVIKGQYGEKIAFRYSKKLAEGDLYCIIIGEHCYNTERYFNKVSFTCDCCGATVETYLSRHISFSDWEVKCDFFDIVEYRSKHFCTERCKAIYKEKELAKLRPDGEQEFFIQKDMFTSNVSGYIYKITKKSTGEFYVGQTQYAPIFRWGQHLKTERFDINEIEDYKFETLYVVPKGENILEVEKEYIKKYRNEQPELCLNVIHNNDKE